MRTFLFGLLCLLVACQGPSTREPAPAPDTSKTTSAAPMASSLPDTTTFAGVWFLQPVLASDTATGKRAFIRFDLARSHFYGNTGCNNMNGQFWYSGRDSSLTFSDKIAITRMACPGYNEPGFLKSLQHTSHYRLRKGVLTLLSDDNTELSRWERKNTPREKTGKI